MNERLTVLVVTYNHINYFEKCMESILSQKTNFNFKIHIVDDKSTDGTTDLVKKYAEKYPNKVKAYIREQNYGVVKNIYEGLKTIDTEYFAFIESDDYWCDDNKLQKQVDALDANPDCSFCGHNTINNYPEDPKNKNNGKKFFKIKTQKISFPTEYKKRSNVKKVHPSSRVYRTACMELDKVRNIQVPVWDSTSFYWFLSKGKMYYIDEVMSVYNRTSTGVYAFIAKSKRKKLQIDNIMSLNKEFDYKYNNMFLRMLKARKVISWLAYFKIKYFTKKKWLEQEYVKHLGHALPLKLYTSIAKNNLGDALNYYFFEHYQKLYFKAYLNDANIFSIGSIMDKLYINKKIKKCLSKEVKIVGSGFIAGFEEYKTTKKVKQQFARKLNILSMRGEISKQRCAEELNLSLSDIPLGDPGLLVNRLVDISKIEKKYDVGIIPHYTDKRSNLFEKIKLEKYSSKIIDVSGDTINTLKEIASCKVILSSAMHGLICADSFGIPNKWIEVSDKVFGNGYKFKDYYSVFGIENPEPINLRNKNIADNDIDDIISSYSISQEKVKEICKPLEEIYKAL